MARFARSLRFACLALALASAVPLTAAAAPDAPAPAIATANLPLFVFIYRQGPAWKPGLPMAKQALGPHATYIAGLLKDGRLVAGGRLVDVNGGLAIVRAANLDEARAMLAADPAITGGVFEADVFGWTPRFVSPDPLPAPR